jgi:hypothetical protein
VSATPSGLRDLQSYLLSNSYVLSVPRSRHQPHCKVPINVVTKPCAAINASAAFLCSQFEASAAPSAGWLEQPMRQTHAPPCRQIHAAGLLPPAPSASTPPNCGSSKFKLAGSGSRNYDFVPRLRAVCHIHAGGVASATPGPSPRPPLPACHAPESVCTVHKVAPEPLWKAKRVRV